MLEFHFFFNAPVCHSMNEDKFFLSYKVNIRMKLYSVQNKNPICVSFVSGSNPVHDAVHMLLLMSLLSLCGAGDLAEGR
jgi:hypothetical protein